MRLCDRLGLLLLWLVATGAAEDPVPVREGSFAEKGAFLTMTVGLPDVVDDSLRKKLRSGFTSMIVLRAYLFREGQTAPLGLTVRTYRVSWDVWEEVYLVQIEDPQGQLNLKFKTEAEAVAQLARLDSFPLDRLANIPIGVNHFVAVLIEVNPISPELLAQARRWLSRPGGTERLSGGDTFFGSFVSIFVNTKVNEAERIIRFRSRPFYRRPPSPRPAARPEGHP
jgi:hypothetical protein